MIGIACIVLVLCVILLMISTGVGPFINEPWLKLHLSFDKLKNPLKTSINGLAILLAIACSAVLIGLVK